MVSALLVVGALLGLALELLTEGGMGVLVRGHVTSGGSIRGCGTKEEVGILAGLHHVLGKGIAAIAVLGNSASLQLVTSPLDWRGSLSCRVV